MIIIGEEAMDIKIHNWFITAEADEIARVAGEIFGGKCFADFKPDGKGKQVLCYEFEPDENYYGALDF